MNTSFLGLWLRIQQEISGSLATPGVCGNRLPVEIAANLKSEPGDANQTSVPEPSNAARGLGLSRASVDL